MRQKPQIATITDPIGIDKVVLKLQNALGLMTYLDEDNITELPWFDSSLIYGVVERSKENLPYILWKGKEFHQMLPNDNYRSLVFFYEHDPREVLYDNATYDISLVVWYDQAKINNGIGYRISEWPIEECRQVLFGFEDVENVRVFKDKRNIFEDWDIDGEFKNRIFNDRFDGFRVRFNISHPVDCGIDFKKKVV